MINASLIKDYGKERKSEVKNNIKLKLILIIFNLALVLTTAKGLRLGGSIGAGELILLGISLIPIIFTKNTIKWKTFLVNNIFWYMITFLLLLGMFIRLNFYSFPNIFPRTLIAYIFCFIVTRGLFKSRIVEREPLLAMKSYLWIIGIIAFAFAILVVLGIRNIGGINLYWLNSQRFQGWSLDPNQFAIPFITAPFFSTYYYSNIEKKTIKQSIIFIAIMVSFVIIYLATDSDSLLVAWGAGAIFSIMHYFYFNLFKRRKLTIPIIMIAILIFGFGIIFLLANPQTIKLYLFKFLAKDGQAEMRFRIWSNSFDMIKLSPLVGLGPDVGLDLGRTDIMGESHNNILHLGMSTGFIGIGTLLFYYLYIFKNVIKSHNALILGAFIAVFIFGLTHYTLRHPTYWVMLLLIDGLAVKDKDNLTYNTLY